jgi:hypothetical protein
MKLSATTIAKKLLVWMPLLISSMFSKAQIAETHYAIETLFSNTPVLYERNLGTVKFNANTNELVFSTNLANLKTGSKSIDSALADQELIQFTYVGNLGKDLFGIVKEENNDDYRKIVGTIIVNSTSYPAEAFLRIKNLAYKSDLSKALFNLRLEVNPKIIFIPYLSSYFENPIVFIIEDEIVNKFRD